MLLRSRVQDFIAHSSLPRLLEMYVHRSGYISSHESRATHCRRRCRLTPSANPNPNPNLPPCDQALWIVHYSRAEPQHHISLLRFSLITYSYGIRYRTTAGLSPYNLDFTFPDRYQEPAPSAERAISHPKGVPNQLGESKDSCQPHIERGAPRQSTKPLAQLTEPTFGPETNQLDESGDS